MNYAQARLRSDGSGYWDWTTKNGDLIWRSAPCSQECKHETSEDAERHFYEHSLASVEESDYEGEWRCDFKGCEKRTSKGLGNASLSLTFRTTLLCDEHRNKESLRIILPFKADLRLIHS